jgi:hypothetical protein
MGFNSHRKPNLHDLHILQECRRFPFREGFQKPAYSSVLKCLRT